MPATPSAETAYEPRVAEVESWARELDALHARIAPRFERAEPRRRAQAYLAVVRSHLPGGAFKGGRSWRSSPRTAP